jgi:hypothetical protein
MWVVLVWQNLPYEFKNSYSDLQNRNFEKSHRTTSTCTGPPSDLRPDTWSWANSGLDTTSRIFENEFFGDDQGELSKDTVLSTDTAVSAGQPYRGLSILSPPLIK